MPTPRETPTSTPIVSAAPSSREHRAAPPVRFHLALGRAVELEQIAVEAAQGLCPRHVMQQIAAQLDAVVHRPDGAPPRVSDRLRSQLAGRPEHWTLARNLVGKLSDDRQVIFCTGEDIGLPVAALGQAARCDARLAMFIHNMDRPRGRAALRWFRAAGRVDLFVTNATHQARFLREYLNLPEDRVWLQLDQTDTRFFCPGPASDEKTRPVVASVGLEQRDYRTLAAATENMNLDVRISGFSRDAQTLRRAFPAVLPDNMTRQFYAWPDLVQLYRDADLVVVSLFENRYSAGINALLEAWACRRPVIITGTTGLRDDYLRDGLARQVPPGDVAALRLAIRELLVDPQAAAELAERGYQHVLQHHDSDRYCEAFAARLAALA